MGSQASMRHTRLRRFMRMGMITVLVLALLSLLLLYGPRYLVRYLVASQLDELHIDYSGVETLIINPFTRELWFGPVSLGSGSSKAAQLELLGLTLGYNSLLHHRIFIERLIVRGIDVAVIRNKQRQFILNGIPLDQWLPPPSTKPQPVVEGEGWKPGIESFELRDSRLIFQNLMRGELVVDVERLSLTDFLAWKPEKSGHFELVAQVNDIQLNWSGEARPFADNITLSIDSRTEQADLPKVIRYTGSFGLDRRDGTYNARLKHELTLFAAGGMEGHTQGVIDVKGADYERKDVFALALEQTKIELDIRYALNEPGDFSMNGKLVTDLGSSHAVFANDTRIAVTTGNITLDNLDTTFSKNGNLRVGLRPKLDLDQVAFSGPIEISVDKLLNVLELLQTLSTQAPVSIADTGLGDFAGSSIAVPASEVKVGRLRSNGESLSLQSAGGKLDLALKTDTDLSDIQIGVNEKNIKVERLQSTLEQLNIVSGEGKLSLDLVGSNALVSGSLNGPNAEVKVAESNDKIKQLGLQVQSGAVSLKLIADHQANGISARVYAKDRLPEVQLQLSSANAGIRQAALDAQGETLHWQVAGDANLNALKVEFAKGKASEMKLDHAELRGLQANERLQLADAMTVNGLDLNLKRSLLEALIKKGEGEASLATPTQVSNFKAGDTASTAGQNDLSRVQTLLTELGYDPGAVDGWMGQRTARAIKAFQTKEGITVDGLMSAGLLAQLELRAAKQTVVEGKSKSTGLQIGLLALNGNPVIHFHDDVVTPQVKVDTVFKEFKVRNLSSQPKDKKTEFNLVALINEFTNIEVTGWSQGLGLGADLKVTANVKNLELPTYSPYVAELAGVYLDSGQLDTTVSAKSSRGLLQGMIKLDLDQLEFKPLSEEDSARLADKVGLPLEMAVSLLQDGDGHIALRLPVSGTLSQPDVDISSAVSKAIGGVFRRVFPPTMVISLLSRLAKGGGPSFEPIVFAPASAELDDAGRGYADEVAMILKERPKLSLKICGRSTSQDMQQLKAQAQSKASAETGAKAAPEQQVEKTPNTEPAPEIKLDPAQLAEDLKELALARKSVVRAYLINNKGIDASRVRECRSTFEASDRDGPRVEIAM
jgi:peptidoglycan hydrolase-like protein with peptidoglycan-binding domain